jgi:RHS repeat-associated protein
VGIVVGLTNPGEPGGVGVPPADPIPGTLVERYDYDPYGRTYIEHWDPTANDNAGGWVRTTASFYGNPIAWTAQRYDAGVGLYQFYARTYSPELGRWLQRDPLGYVDGVNLYEYVRSSPAGLVDPLGFCGAGQLPGFCDGLRKEIEGLAKNLIEDIDNYRPETDTGGKPYDACGNKTKPGGEGKKLADKQNRLRRLRDKYDRECIDRGGPPLTDNVTKAIDKTIRKRAPESPPPLPPFEPLPAPGPMPVRLPSPDPSEPTSLGGAPTLVQVLVLVAIAGAIVTVVIVAPPAGVAAAAAAVATATGGTLAGYSLS